MRIRKGDTASLPAYFETSSGVPLTTSELSLANCLFDINYTDGTTPSAGNAATRYLGDGWYAYDFTDTENKDFIYIARDNTATYSNFPGGLVEIKDVETVDGFHTQVNNTDEQTVFVEIIGDSTTFHSIFLNLYNLSNNTDILVYMDTGALADYEIFYSKTWTSSDDAMVLIPAFTVGTANVKVTLTSSSGEGSDLAVPYSYTIEVL